MAKEKLAEILQDRSKQIELSRRSFGINVSMLNTMSSMANPRLLMWLEELHVY